MRQIPFKRWFFFAIVLKLAIYSVLTYYFQQDTRSEAINFLLYSSKDTDSYYQPLINLADQGVYGSVDQKTGITSFWALRMPGLLPFFLPFYALFGSNIAFLLIGFFQLMASIVAIWAFGKMVLKRTENQLVAGFTMVIFAGSSFVGIYDHFALSESLNVSFLIFSLYYFTRFQYTKDLNYSLLLYSGLCLSVSIFIRPIVGFILPFLTILMLYSSFRQSKQLVTLKTLKKLLAFVIVPVFFISIWTIRNHIRFNQIIPLQMKVSEALPNAFPPERIASMELITLLGYDMVDFSDYTMGDWFLDDSYYLDDFDLSSLPTTPNFNPAQIQKLKNDYQTLKKLDRKSKDYDRVQSKYLDDLYNVETILKEEAPFYILVVAKLKLTKLFIFHRKLTTPFPFPELSEMSVVQKVIKGGNLMLLYFVTFLGLIGILRLNKHPGLHLFRIIVLSFILIMPLLVGYVEQRYFLHPYLFLIPFAVVSFIQICSHLPFVKHWV